MFFVLPHQLQRFRGHPLLLAHLIDFAFKEFILVSFVDEFLVFLKMFLKLFLLLIVNRFGFQILLLLFEALFLRRKYLNEVIETVHGYI